MPGGRTATLTVVALLLLGACSDDDGAKPPPADVVDDDAGQDAGPDAGTQWPDPDAFAWPVKTEPIAIAPSKWGKDSVVFRTDPFITWPQTDAGWFQPRWVKFTVLVGDPSRVHFQHSGKYKLHFEYIDAHLGPWAGKGAAALQKVSLYEQGQELVLGAVLFAPTEYGLEWGMQLVRKDPYHPEMVRRVYELVAAAIKAEKPTDKLEGFYFPTFAQRASAQHFAPWFKTKGIEVGDIGRWGSGACYATGWAMGRVVELQGDGIDAAWQQGKLTDSDILLTDAVPAEIPPVAAVLVRKPSTPNSHVAILARNLGTPFAWLGEASQVKAAEALVGKQALLRVRERSAFQGGCDVWLHDAASLDKATSDTLTALKEVKPIAYPPRKKAGGLTLDLDKAAGTPSQLAAKVGGKAAGMVLLRKAIPANSPRAVALTFDVWDRFMAGKAPDGKVLGDAIKARLSGVKWPAEPAKFSATAAAIRADVLGTAWSDKDAEDVIAALKAAGFSAEHKLRFRSSTNVEDGAAFTGAGLYESYSGCLADDLDGDAAGPSACNPGKADERGALRAIRKVFASFYADGALRERLRHGVKEAEVAMAVLVHHSFPDPAELANGVCALDTRKSWADEAELVSQAGAVSVTNPSTAALPELVNLSIDAKGKVGVHLQTASSLVPLGAHVMSWQADYQLLGGLFDTARKAFGAAHGKAANSFLLDFEFKKMKAGHVAQPPPAASDWLVVKQMRELPLPGGGAGDVPILVGDTVDRCTFQGEYGDVLGIHRLKSRWTLKARTGPVAADKSLFAHIRVEHLVGGKLVVTAGPPDTLPGYSHESEPLKGYQPPRSKHVDSFTVTTPAGKQTWRLEVHLPDKPDPATGPMVVLSDQGDASESRPLYVHVQHPAKVVKLDWSATPKWIDKETTRLGVCPPDVAKTPQHKVKTRKLVGKLPGGKEVTLQTSYLWPPGPKGASAGYTAPLMRWEGASTLTGLTTKPITITDWFARSHRPEHHNFGAFFVLEPALDTGVEPAAAAELAKDGVRLVFVHGDGSGAKVVLLDAAGKVLSASK